jgi:hypothetical protein
MFSVHRLVFALFLDSHMMRLVLCNRKTDRRASTTARFFAARHQLCHSRWPCFPLLAFPLPTSRLGVLVSAASESHKFPYVIDMPTRPHPAFHAGGAWPLLH